MWSNVKSGWHATCLVQESREDVIQPAVIVGNVVEMSHVLYIGNVSQAPIHQSFGYSSRGNFTFGPVIYTIVVLTFIHVLCDEFDEGSSILLTQEQHLRNIEADDISPQHNWESITVRSSCNTSKWTCWFRTWCTIYWKRYFSLKPSLYFNMLWGRGLFPIPCSRVLLLD